MEITKADQEAIEKFSDILNRGRYAVSQEVTEVYNRVLNKAVRNTNCSSCIRQRVFALKEALELWKREQEKKGSES